MRQTIHNLAIRARREEDGWRFQQAPAMAEETAVKKILRSGKSLQKGIAFFSVVIIIAISVLIEAVISTQRKANIERARFDSANLSAIFEEQVRQIIDTVSLTLDRLKDDIQERRLDSVLRELGRHPDLGSIPAEITIVGSDGKVVESSFGSNLKGLDLSDREHFRAHIGNRQRGLVIGKPIRGRFTRQLTVPLTMRLEKADGKFDGILIASLDPQFLSSLYRSVDLGQTGSLTLLGTDGILRAYFTASAERAQTSSSVIGPSLADVPALRDSEFDPEGAFEMQSRLDGVVRLFHWRKVRGYPLIVIAGLGKAEALQASKHQESLVLAAGGFALILTVFMPLLLYREMSKRIANEIDLNSEKVKLRDANDTLATERQNLRNINEELIMEKRRAEEASRAKSNFLMNMSHEFRTPMHAMLNYTNMALKKIQVEDSEKIEKYIKNTRTAGLRLLRMLNDLLDLAKLEAGKIELQLRDADLTEAIQETEFELGSLLEEKQLRVALQMDCDNARALFDPHRLVQVLVNLFSNAIKFSPHGGTIQIVVSNTVMADGRPALQCSVLDEGVGIPEDELGKIFDRFSQSSTTTKAGGGSGLGLTICRELIDLHGGKIWAANREEGGAAVSFVIPTQSTPPASTDFSALTQIEQLAFSLPHRRLRNL